MKYITLFLTITFSTLFFQDQNPDYLIKLKSGSFTPEVTQNFSEFAIQKKAESSSKHLYSIVQFYSLPVRHEKELIKNAGIELLSYIPNNAYIAKINAGFDAKKFETLNIRSIIDVNDDFKLDNRLKASTGLSWFEESKKLSLRVKLFTNEDETEVRAFLQKHKANIKGYLKETNVFYLDINSENLSLLSAHPFIQWIEPTEPEATPDDNISRGNTKANVLNSSHNGGRKYDGSGVSVALSDSGLIGPHIDFEGRVTPRTDESTGNHGDMTSGLFVGAGNLNPRNGGIVPGADIHIYKQGSLIFIDSYQHYLDAVDNYNNNGVVITSTSFSQGQGGIYTSDTQFADRQVNQNPAILHVLSAGNSGAFDHGYGAGPGWANISGGIKAGKNVICAGNLDEDDQIFTTSSRGPAADGRIKPDLCTRGERVTSTDKDNTYQGGAGTSAATPIIAGVGAQLYQAYRSLNGDQDPESALIKGIMLNTARDMGNTGPDFIYGWGKLNALRAVRVIEEERYISGTIDQGESLTFNIEVPANVSRLNVMTYWADAEGNPAAATALVNDIDMLVQTSNGVIFEPWVLDPSPNPSSLNAPATRGIDRLNNMEQVTVDQPTVGSYEVQIDGSSIAQGPQSFYIIYDFIIDDIELTHPLGGEKIVPGEREIINWMASNSQESFTLELSTDGGSTYELIADNIDSNRRFFEWTVPNTVSAAALIRLSRTTQQSTSADLFNLIETPNNLEVVSVCPETIVLEWDDVADSESYQVWQLGEKYMEPIGTSSESTFEVLGLNPNQEHWFSVSAIHEGSIGQRAIAVRQEEGTRNCILDHDMKITSVTSPQSGTVPNCIDLSGSQVTLIIDNLGLEASNELTLNYQINNQVIISEVFSESIMPSEQFSFSFTEPIDLSSLGAYEITCWLEYNLDENTFNDSLNVEVNVIESETRNLPHSQAFNSFSECRTLWTTCDLSCNLSDGYINFENGIIDDIDWRARNGATPSFNFVDTGVSGDYDMNGLGNYLYLESIENCHFREGSIMSPCIELSDSGCPMLEFAYSMFGSRMGELHVDLVTSEGIIKDVMPPISGNQGLGWKVASIDLSPYVNGKVNLIITGITGDGSASVMAIDAISIIDMDVNPDFDFQTDDASFEVSFTDNSSGNVDAYQWDFGDGNSSTEENPTHTYSEAGTYEVTLTITGPCGMNTISQTVTIMTTSILNLSSGLSGINVYPNPNKGNFIIEIPSYLQHTALSIKIYDILGNEHNVFETKNQETLNINDLNVSEGIIILEMSTEGRKEIKRISIHR